MENKIDINKISVGGPGGTRGQLANKASAQLMNQQENNLRYSTSVSVANGLSGSRDTMPQRAYQILRAYAPLAKIEVSSFLYAIYAKKNYTSIINNFKEIYGLNNRKKIAASTRSFPPNSIRTPDGIKRSIAPPIALECNSGGKATGTPGARWLASQGKNIPTVYKHFPPAIREWSNSIFTFYPNLTLLMGFAIDKMVIKIIKSYFNSKNKKGSFEIFDFEAQPKKNDRQLGVKDKVYLSKLTVKHTSSKVIITVYIYATLYKELD